MSMEVKRGDVPLNVSSWTHEDVSSWVHAGDPTLDLKTTVGEHTQVSTVRLPDLYKGWALLDRGERPEPGAEYETLVFRDGKGDVSTRRTYATADEARVGHSLTVIRERAS